MHIIDYITQMLLYKHVQHIIHGRQSEMWKILWWKIWKHDDAFYNQTIVHICFRSSWGWVLPRTMANASQQEIKQLYSEQDPQNWDN